MATKATKTIPEGMQALTTELWFNGNCNDAIEFYKTNFNAKVQGNVDYAPDRKVIHALLSFNGSNIMAADISAMGGSSFEKGPEEFTTASLYLYVDDADAMFKRAINAGCRSLMPVLDAFWGDRTGQLRDPFGHVWTIATHKVDMTPEEMKQRENEWLEQHHGVIQ